MTRYVRRLVLLLVFAGAGVGPLGCGSDGPTVRTSKEKPPQPKVYPGENPPKK